MFAKVKAVADLMFVGSFCIMFDIAYEGLPAEFFLDRSCVVGNNPQNSVPEWLNSHPDLEIHKSINISLLISMSSD